MENLYIRSAGSISVFLIFLLFCKESHGQLNPLGGVYFENQYLVNPAMAGLDSGLMLNLGFRQQWSSVPGAPKTHSVSGTYKLSEKVGLGVNAYNDEAGLIRRTKLMGSYSYHLPINGQDQKLSFGISLGFMNERIGYEDIQGDAGDQNIGRFNERETFIDGDFGAAYSSSNLTIQGAIPNLKNFFGKDEGGNTVDRAIFFTAFSYKFYFPDYLDGLGFEPKVCFRGVRGYDNITDIGANVTFANQAVNLMAIYHTSRSASYGMGINYKKSISLSGIYTTETAALSGYTNGNFEIAMRLNIF